MLFAKNDEFLQINKCFTYIKIGESINSNLNRIESSLSRVFEMNFHLSIINNERANFFGVNVYPSIETTDKIITSILDTSVKSSTIVQSWQESKDWYVEIDSMLMDSIDLNASPGEIVALILHEIGHVVYSNSVVHTLTATIREKIVRLNYITKKLLSDDKIRKLFYLTILEVCSFKDFNYKVDDTETISDRFINQYGFRDEMNNLIEKIIERYGNEYVNRNSDDIDNTIKIMVNWVIVNVRELEFRKKELRNSLKVELMTTSSDLVKRVIQHIYGSFFGSVVDKYRMLLSEQYNENPVDKVALMEAEQYLDKFYKDLVTEATGSLFDKRGKIKKVNQLDIDILYADISRIQTNDDKIYLLDKLYIQQDKVNTALDYIEMGNVDKVGQSKSTLLNMKKQLERIRQEILATRIVDKQYGLFIKYPAGYQG